MKTENRNRKAGSGRAAAAQVYLNGTIIPEAEARVSIFDRCFLYGDGLFEVMFIANGNVFRWRQHIQRLERGAEFMKLRLPRSLESLRNSATELISRNHIRNGLLRLTISRGVGVRGYSPKGAEKPMVVMSVHPLDASPKSKSKPARATPLRWNLVTASVRLPAAEPLAQYKTCNKLTQIVARMEADEAGADEALLANTDGHLVEGSSSNLFWIERGAVCTPPLTSGILAGVTRSVVMEICQSLGLKTREKNVTAAGLDRKEGVFVSLSSRGVVAARSINGRIISQSKLIEKIRLTYHELVTSETTEPNAVDPRKIHPVGN